MDVAPFRVEALEFALDRDGFWCGSAPLDRYFQEQVAQDIRRRVTACFVALSSERSVDRIA